MTVTLGRFEHDFSGPLFEEATERRALAVVSSCMEVATNRLKNGIARNTPVNTGALRASFLASGGIRITPHRVVEGIVGSPLIYAPIVEFGRAPGPISPAGLMSIAQWVRRKLKPPRTPKAAGKATRKKGEVVLTEAEVVFLVVRKIRTQGSDGAQMIENTLKTTRIRLNADLRECARRWATTWNGGR